MSAETIQAVILGAGGYVAGELLRLLHSHPVLRLAAAVSKSAPGQPLTSRHPGLITGPEVTFRGEIPWEELAPGPILWALCLEPGKAQEQVPFLLEQERARGFLPGWVVDCSGDFRFSDPDKYRLAYGREHRAPDLCDRFQFGLPELFRDRIASARLVANPGCMATAVILALAPLAREGWLAGPVSATAITGSSGAGASLKETSHHPWRAGNLQPYRPMSHQHEPEIAEYLSGCGSSWDLYFTAVRAPLVRGISVVAQGQLREAIETSRLRQCFDDYYAGNPFHLACDEPPSLSGVTGTNRFALYVGSRGRRLLACSAIDNLTKGAAGQAIQNANLMLGLPEASGLVQPAITPW